MTTKAKVTEEGLLIPKEVADRALGKGSEEVEIFEEPGRLVVATARESRGTGAGRYPLGGRSDTGARQEPGAHRHPRRLDRARPLPLHG